MVGFAEVSFYYDYLEDITKIGKQIS
jgi:hypothetical protein